MIDLSGILNTNRRRIVWIVLVIIIIGVVIFLVSSYGSQSSSTPVVTPTRDERILKAVGDDSDTKSHSLAAISVASSQVIDNWIYAQVVFGSTSGKVTYAIVLYEDSYGTVNVVAGIDDPMNSEHLKRLSVPQAIIDLIPTQLPAEYDEATYEGTDL